MLLAPSTRVHTGTHTEFSLRFASLPPAKCPGQSNLKFPISWFTNCPVIRLHLFWATYSVLEHSANKSATRIKLNMITYYITYLSLILQERSVIFLLLRSDIARLGYVASQTLKYNKMYPSAAVAVSSLVHSSRWWGKSPAPYVCLSLCLHWCN